MKEYDCKQCGEKCDCKTILDLWGYGKYYFCDTECLEDYVIYINSNEEDDEY